MAFIIDLKTNTDNRGNLTIIESVFQFTNEFPTHTSFHGGCQTGIKCIKDSLS